MLDILTNSRREITQGSDMSRDARLDLIHVLSVFGKQLWNTDIWI